MYTCYAYTQSVYYLACPTPVPVLCFWTEENSFFRLLLYFYFFSPPLLSVNQLHQD